MLKKNILFLILFLSFSISKAQSYSPFVVDSAVWIIQGDDIAATPWIDTYYGYYMCGDTIVNSFNYKKIYSLSFHDASPNWTFPLQLDSMELSAIIRESAKKIYAITLSNNPAWFCSNGSEFLLYDYNYNIGDTVNLCLQLNKTDTIQSIVTNGGFNRRTFITNENLEYIEGIGSSMGLFEGVFVSVSPGIRTSLYNYCQGNLASCNISTNVKTISNLNQFNVYPNPAQSQIAIEFDLLETKNVSIEIKNILGQTLKTINSSAFKKGSNKIEIDVLNFPSGLYFVQLQSENKVACKKFVKE